MKVPFLLILKARAPIRPETGMSTSLPALDEWGTLFFNRFSENKSFSSWISLKSEFYQYLSEGRSRLSCEALDGELSCDFLSGAIKVEQGRIYYGQGQAIGFHQGNDVMEIRHCRIWSEKPFAFQLPQELFLGDKNLTPENCFESVFQFLRDKDPFSGAGVDSIELKDLTTDQKWECRC